MPEKDRRSPSAFRSLSTRLALGMIVCFAVQRMVIVPKAYDAYLVLSGYGMKSGHLWELVTYQFFHTGLIHLLINVAGLWFVGRAAEARLGRRRFVLIYFGSSLAGALLQGAVAVIGYWLPESREAASLFIIDRFGGGVAGASVGLCGVFAAYCSLKPEPGTSLFFLGRIKPLLLLWIALGLAALFVVIPSNPSLAHLAHLGGLLAGLAFIKLGRQSDAVSGVEAP